jgi:hypothetical protein
MGNVTAGNIKRTFLAHCEVNWTLVDANHATCSLGSSQTLYLATLLPATPSPSYHVTNEYTYASVQDAQYRLEVDDTPGTAQSYFLHVMSPTSLTPSVSFSGGVYTVTLDANHSLQFNQGSTSSGGSITINGTATNFRSDVQGISVGNSGPVWEP